MANESGLLAIGTVSIPDGARITWEQSRQTIRSEVQIEYSDLSAEIQQGPVSAAKRLWTLSCSGWEPPGGIEALDRTTTHTLTWEELTGPSTWTTRTATVWIWEGPTFRDNPRDPGGGSSSWTLTLREA